MRLLLITDGLSEDLDERLRLACRILAGVPFFVQLRARGVDGSELLAAARRMVKLLDERAPLVVNDRLDVARAAKAAGVHLPARGLPVHVARDLWPDGLVGRSTHDLGEVAAAQRDGADYVVFGPIGMVPGKRSVGWTPLAGAVRQAAPLPLFALGGLGPADLPRLDEVGAHLAVLRGGLGAPSLAACERQLSALAAAYSARRSVSV